MISALPQTFGTVLRVDLAAVSPVCREHGGYLCSNELQAAVMERIKPYGKETGHCDVVKTRKHFFHLGSCGLD